MCEDHIFKRKLSWASLASILSGTEMLSPRKALRMVKVKLVLSHSEIDKATGLIF